METLWFWLLAFLLATYVVLDGFDLGTGVLHLFVARSEEGRREVLHSIGPVWDGNEVWLIAAGGTLVLAFPVLYATAFSGFYLPLMMVLWLLMGRALGIEMRHQMEHERLWTQFWDAIFAISSFLLTIFFGAALGNVVRGVPLQADGTFFEPLWTDFRVGAETGILDWYTILVGITALIALMYHAALWLSWRTHQDVNHRASRAIPFLVGPLIALWIATILGSIQVQPLLKQNLLARPWGAIFPFLSFPAIVASFYFHKRKNARTAFLSSAFTLYMMVFSAAAGLYPYVLPARSVEYGFTVTQTASAHGSLSLALFWWIPGVLLAAAYSYFVYSRLLTREVPSHPLSE